MYVYLQKWESPKVYLKLLKSEVIGFPRLQSLRLFFVVDSYLDRGRGGGGVRMRVVNCRGVGGGV